MSWDLAHKLLALFAMIALGWGAARRGLLGGVDGQRVLATAAFDLFLPALLFRTTAALDVTRLPGPLLLAFFAPLVAWSVGVWAWGRRRQVRATRSAGSTGLPWHPPIGSTDSAGSAGREADATAAAEDAHPAMPAVRAVGLSFGNSVQVGLPFAASLFGQAGLQLHLAIVSLHALLLLSVLTVLAEVDVARAAASRGARVPVGALLLTIARQTLIHPVVLPVLAGIAWQLGGLGLHPVADTVLQTLGQAGVPLCLILIGASLAQHGLGGRGWRLLGPVALKLLVLPAGVMLLAVTVFGLHGLPLAVVVMAAALPTGSNALLFAQRYRTGEGAASALIVLSTLGFGLTAPLWLSVLLRAGG